MVHQLGRSHSHYRSPSNPDRGLQTEDPDRVGRSVGILGAAAALGRAGGTKLQKIISKNIQRKIISNLYIDESERRWL
jgi:hypothetical protein